MRKALTLLTISLFAFSCGGGESGNTQLSQQMSSPNQTGTNTSSSSNSNTSSGSSSNSNTSSGSSSNSNTSSGSSSNSNTSSGSSSNSNTSSSSSNSNTSSGSSSNSNTSSGSSSNSNTSSGSSSNSNTSSSSSNSNNGRTITLRGKSYDSPIPNAIIKIKAIKTDGTEEVIKTVTADENGNWNANIDSNNIPQNSILIAETNGTLHGKQVIFKSILGKGREITNLASNHNEQLDSSVIPELTVSNISSVDTTLALLKSNSNKTKLAEKGDILKNVLKVSKLKIRKKIAAAVKAFVDGNATLRDSELLGSDTEPKVERLIKTLVVKSVDGKLERDEIRNVFNSTADYEKFLQAESELLEDNNLREVLIKGTTELSSYQLFNALKGRTFYWKDFPPDIYRKLTISNNGSINATIYQYDFNSGNWNEVNNATSNSEAQYDPANLVYRLVYDNANDKLYLLTRLGTRFEVSLVSNKDDKVYNLLLTNTNSTNVNWSSLLQFVNATNIPLVMAYGNRTYTSINGFINHYSECSSPNNPPLPPDCFFGALILDNGKVKISPSIDNQTGNLAVGEYEVQNDTLVIKFYDPDESNQNQQSQAQQQSESEMKGVVVIKLYNPTEMGNFNSLILQDASKINRNGVQLQRGIPLITFQPQTIKLSLFRDEDKVRSYVPPELLSIASMEENTSEGGTQLPQDAKETLCDVRQGTDSNGTRATITCNNNQPESITIGTSTYYIDDQGGICQSNQSVCPNNQVVGHILEITPFSFTVELHTNNTTSTYTFVNHSKKEQVINNMRL